MTDIAAATQPWYRTLGPAQWKTLVAANLGWVFDGYETYALIISVGVALRQLLDPDRAQRLRLGLAVVRGIAVSRGACDRLRMGDRHLDRFRALARQEPRQGQIGRAH